ncbi:Glucoside xylosyltransferase 1 [Willisornis vidua]|uniref:Glucoside xylosyltransferase 1 n=1 Tax=Willisornis vidua TaxID=1566151 RepID=A0ABQ9CK14_9PASS|nr:Glucoside xylosyltransferase 1 [Willisornis vidua]
MTQGSRQICNEKNEPDFEYNHQIRDAEWQVMAAMRNTEQRARKPRYDYMKTHPSEKMHLAVVACGERLEETVTMLRSAIIFSIRPLHFHIFAEDQLHESFKDILILKNVDSLLYVDTDILFLRPVDDIWSFLGKFNSTQVAAMAPEHEEPRIGWYNRFARHPYYGLTGINSGVMLMNMTRIRRKYFKNDMTPVRLQWREILMPLLKKYKLNITWGDQDLLNIMFYHNPESLYVFPCQWNYRPDHCIYGSNCKAAEEEGIFILHGNRGVYHDDKQPTFRAVYEAIKNYSFGDDLVHSLLQPLELELQKTMHTYCGRVYKVFLKQLTKSIRDLYARRSKGRELQACHPDLSASEAMDQIILSAITQHVQDNLGIRPSQQGISKGKFCLTNLSFFCDKVTHLVNKGKAMDVI